MSAPTREQIDDIYRRRIQQARRTPPEEKLLDCLELYDRACLSLRDGLRAQNPNDSESEVTRKLRMQMERVRRLEERGLYHPAPTEPAP